MAKYQAVYKCPLCGTLLRWKEPQEAPYDALAALCGKFVGVQRFASNPAFDIPPAQVPCKCKDGSCGMATFAGFKKVEG